MSPVMAFLAVMCCSDAVEMELELIALSDLDLGALVQNVKTLL
jgi:hypothetical protein